jgi:hypothetical protein
VENLRNKFVHTVIVGFFENLQNHFCSYLIILLRIDFDESLEELGVILIIEKFLDCNFSQYENEFLLKSDILDAYSKQLLS